MTRIVDKRRARHGPTALLGRRELLSRLGASAALPLLPGEAFAQPRGQARPIAPVAHRTLLGKGIPIVEGIDLRDVEAGTYDLIVLPMKVAGHDGAPARAILRSTTQPAARVP